MILQSSDGLRRYAHMGSCFASPVVASASWRSGLDRGTEFFVITVRMFLAALAAAR